MSTLRSRGGREPSRLWTIAVVSGPAALAAALCFYEITTRSLGFDESASVTIAAQHGHRLYSAIAHDGGNMSGYYVLLHVLLTVFGHGQLLVRIPSAIAIAATAGLVAGLGLRLFDRQVALAAGLLSAVSLPLVFWGQAARGYAPMVTLATASVLSFVVLVERSEGRGRSPVIPFVAYVITTALAVYMSFTAVLVPVAELVVLATRREMLSRALKAAVICVLCWIPLVVLAAGRGTGQLFWVPRPSLTGEKQVLELLTSAGLQPSFRNTSTTWVLAVVTVALVLLAAWRAGRARLGRERAWPATLLLSWLVVPIAIAWIESLFAPPIFLPRNLLVSVPAVSLLLAWVVMHPRLPMLAGLVALAALLALRALQLAPSYGVSPEDWRGATAYVLAHAGRRDCIAFYPSDGRMAFQYYLGTRALAAPRPVLPALRFGVVRPFVEEYASLSPAQLRGLAPRCPRMWFVSSHEGQRDGPAGSKANYARYLALRSDLHRVYARTRTNAFGYAAVIRVELLQR